MAQSKYQAIIFDCDGTLVDSEHLAIKVLVSYVAELGFTLDYQRAFTQFVGTEMHLAMNELERLSGSMLPKDFLVTYRQRMLAAFKTELKPMLGATELLSQLNVPFCIASNGPKEKMQVSLIVTQLARFFPAELIFSAYDVDAFKPSPTLFLHAAKALDVMPQKCLAIEDSPSGIKAGLAADMDVAAIGQEALNWRSHERVTQIHSLLDVKALI